MGFVSRCEGWEGLTVDGKFPLLEWQRGWANRCVFLTVRQQLQVASIKLILASGSDADAYLAKWEAARALSHPFLVHMMETGRCVIDGKSLVYVVTEKADAVLSGVIPRKELDSAAAKEIINPIVDALAFVHEKGLVHGSVKPSNIVLVGGQWKLSADELVAAGENPKLIGELTTYDAPELASGNFTPAADMWSLGMIVTEAFAQRTPAWDRTTESDPTVPNWLPQPFLKIARGCVRWEPADRCSIREVKALLARCDSLESEAEPAPDTAKPVAGPTAMEAVAVEKQPSKEPEKASEELIAEPASPPVPTEPAVEPVEERSQEKATETEKPPAAEKASGEEKAPEELIAEPARPPEEPEPAELTPRSRLFTDLDEEEKPRSRVGRVLAGLVVLAVIALLAVRGHWINFSRSSQTRSVPAQTQPSVQPQAAQTQPQGGPAESQSVSPQGQATSQGQTVPETQSAPATAQSAPETSPSAPSPQEATNEEPESQEKVQTQPTAKPANSDGAVTRRVLPNVAPGAIESMRAPVEVEVRVYVNEDGAVSDAEYVTLGPGNYFARIARQAAGSWKFKPPESEGQPRASVWTLRFRFERKQTEVTASEEQ